MSKTYRPTKLKCSRCGHEEGDSARWICYEAQDQCPACRGDQKSARLRRAWVAAGDDEFHKETVDLIALSLGYARGVHDCFVPHKEREAPPCPTD